MYSNNIPILPEPPIKPKLYTWYTALEGRVYCLPTSVIGLDADGTMWTQFTGSNKVRWY